MYPILFKIGPVTLYTYGVLIAIGFLVGLALAVRQGRKQGIDKERILDLGFYILIAAIAGSRLLFVALHYDDYLKEPFRIFKIWEGGLVFYGGLILVIPVVIWYVKRHSLSLWRVADVFAPSLAIGHAIGRLGCFSAGCCYGKPSGLPWAVTFTNPNSLANLGIPLHPTQLYESLGEFIIFIFLIVLRRRSSFNGRLFAVYFMLYAVLRFFIEFFRGDEVRGYIYGGFSTSQGISLLVLATGILMYIILRRKKLNQK